MSSNIKKAIGIFALTGLFAGAVYLATRKDEDPINQPGVGITILINGQEDYIAHLGDDVRMEWSSQNYQPGWYVRFKVFGISANNIPIDETICTADSNTWIEDKCLLADEVGEVNGFQEFVAEQGDVPVPLEFTIRAELYDETDTLQATSEEKQFVIVA